MWPSSGRSIAKENRLEFSTAWGAPGRRAEAFIQESMGLTFRSGDGPARVAPGRMAAHSGLPTSLGEPASSAPAGCPAPGDGLRLGSAGPRRQQRARGPGVLLPLRISAKTRRPWRPLKPSPPPWGRCWPAPTNGAGPRSSPASRRSCSTRLPTASAALIATAWSALPIPRQPACWAPRPLNSPASRSTSCCTAPRRPTASARRIAPCARAADMNKAASGEDTIFRSDGSSFPAEYVFTPIREQGRFSGSVLSFRDISQRYALDRLKDEFISTVSHELRTPLTSIRGALGPALLRHSRRGQRQGGQPAPHCSHQLRPPGPAHQRYPRPGTHPERPRAARLPPGAVG